jgi:hypothetical protein
MAGCAIQECGQSGSRRAACTHADTRGEVKSEASRVDAGPARAPAQGGGGGSLCGRAFEASSRAGVDHKRPAAWRGLQVLLDLAH